MEVASDKFDVYGTPMGYLIDEQGNIVGEAGVGADGLVALAVASRADATDPPKNGTAEHGRRAMVRRAKSLKARSTKDWLRAASTAVA